VIPFPGSAAGPGGGQASGGAFADQAAFELGQGREDVEDELAAGMVVSIASCKLRNPIPRCSRRARRAGPAPGQPPGVVARCPL
jgi:hypothetical protein